MSTGLTKPPDEQGLQALLKEAYEQLPSPDAWRLKDIEERLSRQLARAPRPERRPPLWPWWLAAALVAASAAAAWWAYEATKTAPDTEAVPALRAPAEPLPAPSQSERRSGGPGTGDTEREAAPAQAPTQERTPLIYRREKH